MQRISDWYGRLLDGMLAIACALLFGMTFLIGFYLTTVLAAPAVLRRGQHIRVDILLRVLPPRLAWCFEWIGDIIGVVCCVYFVWYGVRVTLASYAAGAVSIKTLVLPEWWLLAPMPVCFLLLAIEFVFRMRCLALAERAPRADAVSAA
jgi:TRAP-type transport system small permease protein